MIKKNILFCFALTLFVSTLVQAQAINIIPQPNEIIIGEESFSLNKQTRIIASIESIHSATIFQEKIMTLVGYKLEITDRKQPGTKFIEFKKNNNLEKEAYELNVSKTDIQLIASNNTGWFYGVQSLIQLLPEQKVEQFIPPSIQIPAVEIKDSPRFSWRAFMLDEARYFKGSDQVKLLLDEMAALKMNVFHWHLVDDQGWRIEIKKYPLLTQVGSKRASSQIGPLKWKSSIQSGEPHEGFYTQKEIKELIKYAAERHITVVPEIEMPGHSSAAIASYPWLGTAKNEIEVPIKFGVGKDVYDVTDPRVYEFLTDVLDEVIELFSSEVIHIGGDEVKYNHWKESQSVQAYMKTNDLLTPADLQVYFTNTISYYLQNKGRRMMGWNEILGHNLHTYQDQTDTETNQKLAKQTVIHFWKGDVDLANQAASSGYDIVNSLNTFTYLDYDYNQIPLSMAYSFEPIPKNLDPKYHHKIIGSGCQMWGEWIPFNGQMHYLVFPRIAAFAEVGWTQKENKDFNQFKSALQKLKNRWDEQGIYYAPDEVVEKTN